VSAAGKRWPWIAWLAGAVALVALSVAAHGTAYFSLDLTVTQAMQRLQSPALDTVMQAVDWLGFVPQVVILVGLAAVWLWVARKRWEGALLMFAMGAEGTAAVVIKLLVRRPRPEVTGLHIYQPLSDYTYPSGHVFCYAVVCGLLIYYIQRFLRPSRWRTAGSVVLAALALAIGPVRVYLGAHWLSDVAAGYLLAGLSLPLLIALHQWGERRFAPKSNR